MNRFLRINRIALVICLAIGLSSSIAVADDHGCRPNWKVTATGTATLDSITDVDGVPFRNDIDAFSGKSSHLGKFTATGHHSLNLNTGEFAGVATYRGAHGDSYNVAYSGQLYPSGDPAFPYLAIADIEIHGGTGRFRHATGHGVLTGGFTGAVPVGDFFFSIEGTLHTK